MNVTDPIADLLTRIRNALVVKHKRVIVPISKIKVKIIEILKKEGFIKNYQFIKYKNLGYIRIYLKYDENDEGVITGLKRISKPGLRQYVNSKNLPKVLNGLGIAIISTSKGIKTDHDCQRESVGGEVLCHIW
ncbi:MAG: 30S ribosomal protein S8 [Nitrospinae bacterium]|nr:30S ribosomal protein S8 [Nitrospinota bacterium]